VSGGAKQGRPRRNSQKNMSSHSDSSKKSLGNDKNSDTAVL
jgi:hypothetical protein